MEELLKDLRGVCEKHGLTIEKDSESLELGCDGEIVFRCRDLNRVNMEANIAQKMIEELQNVSFYGGQFGYLWR